MIDARLARSSSPEVAPTGAETRAVRPATWIDLGDFLALALQLGLVLGVALLYHIELERGFGIVAAVMFLGFLVHTWLPARARLPFFVFLTISAIGILLRADGLWL